MKLRDQLLNSLKSLPGTRNFRLHVLVAAPHKHAELYPYASVRPRIYGQHILILCSEEVDVRNIGSGSTSELGFESAPSPRVFVTVIEATLYHIPANSSAILYIAKVDSTGQGRRPSPTSTLVPALIAHYASLKSRPPKLRGTTLWVHLFARAERQYLFPNSADHPSKKPLNDVKLCSWWKRVLGRVVQELAAEGEVAKLYYVLPGMNELEALQALGETHFGNDAKSPTWIYGHPYFQEVPLPYNPVGKTLDAHNLGQVIPSFEDDPKSRFMDEIACTTQVDGLRSPQRKRRRIDSEHTGKDEKATEKVKENRIHGELGVVTADEFWERMSFRQECIAGAITGFFVLIFPSRDSDSASRTMTKDGLSANPLAPQPGEVSHHLVQRVIKSLMTGHDFSTSERSLSATSILEDAIRGLCSGSHVPGTCIEKQPPSFLTTAKRDDAEKKDGSGETKTEEPLQFLELPKTPPSNRRALQLEDISPNPFPEPEPSADTYSLFIHGAVSVSNPESPPPEVASKDAITNRGPAVTVLTVRKKKRK